MLSWLKRKLGVIQYQTDEVLLAKYLEAGGVVGSMLYERYIGKAVGYEEMLDWLIKLEREIVVRGYASIPMQLFVMMWCQLGQLKVPKRKAEDKVILHAQVWKDKYRDDQIFGNILGRVMEEGVVCEVIVEDNIFAYESELGK